MTGNVVLPVKRHEYVIAKVDNTTATKFKFKVNEQLRGKRIVGLAFHTSSYLTTDPEGNTLAASAIGINKGFVTLKTKEGTEVVNKLPLYMLAPGVNAGGTYEKFLPVERNDIDFEQSYIELSNNTALVANTTFMLSVLFDESAVGCPAK